MNRNKPGIIKRILNALERFIARIRGKDAYLAVEQRQAAERLRDMLTGELKRAYGTDVKGEAAVESGEGKRHSLAGANSRTADLNSLGGAYQMYQNGVSTDTIRKRTGWWLGKDGKWRYEISDKEMRFNPEGYVDNPQTVGDYVKHDRLFAAYPWIMDVNVLMSENVAGDPNSLGRYVPSENFIELKTGVPTEKTKHVLIHELQHAIQNKEHFTNGTNSTVTSRYIVNLAYNNVKNNPEFKAEKSPRGKMDYIIGYLEARMDANFDDIAKYYYSRNHGEIEAQYVDKRLDMSDNARKAEPIVNYGDVYTREDVRADFIDNLKEMGYNEEQVNEILEKGIPYDNKHQNEQESLGQTGEGRKNLAGEAGRLPRQGTQRGERREVYRTGKVQVADSVKKTGQVDSLSDSTIFRRGRTDSETGRNGVREAQKRLNEVSKLEKRFSLSSNVEQIIENDSGEFVAESDGNGGTRWSLSTYESSGRETLRQYLDGQVSESGLTEADAKAVLDSMDDIYEICRKYEGEYAPFGAWSRAEVVIDEKGNPVFSVVKPNGEYAMNLDFSLVCKKRRALDAVLNRLIETGAINDFGFGQEEIVRVNEIIREHGFEIACDMCFVDAKRYRQAGVADQFVDLYNSIVKSMAKDGQEIDYFNFANDSSLSHTEGGIDRLSDAELDFSEINEITKPGAKKTVEYRIAQYLKTHPSDRKLLSRGDFMSTAGFDAVKVSKPGILKLYNSKKGTGGPKAAQSDVQYLNDILSSKKFNRSAAYDVGGVRVQSFSDYVPRLVFDYVQMIGDLAAKRLPAHAYTKEPLFAKQFGLTGMKINMSLMPAKGNGKYAGLNADGSYAWARESFPAEEAFRIQADPEYGKNVGTIAVGISDEHIWKMLSDPDIRMVIPYHKSGINPAVAVKLKIGEYTDYTGQQNTRRRDGRQLTKAELKNIPDINRLMHRDGLDAVEASRRYVEWCEDNGYIPKFEKFAYTTDSDGSRVFNENYYKLLEDFTTMVDGEFHPQGDVTATFPGSDSAFGSMADLIKEGLEEDAVTANRLNGEVDGLAEEVRSALVREESGKRFSLTRANDEYMKAVESGNVEEQQRLVDEAAENAGYDTVLYHGTQSFGFTQIDVSKYSDDGISFFATSNPEMAQTYSAKSGTREISRKSGIENLSLPQVVDRLNAVAAADTSDYDRYTYRIMNRSDTEALKKSIQSGIKELRAETERLISEYADRLAKDFNGEDELKHSRLRSLLNALDSDSASKLSANLYTVLNHNEIFDDAAKVKFGNLEADIRLLEKLAALKTDEDVVVREDTDRYYIVVEDQEKARKRLEKFDNSGNYVLRGRTEGFLEIDGNGHNWNDIFTTLEPKGGNTLKAEYDFGSESLKLSDRDGEFAVIPAKSVADAVSPMARAFARRYGTTFATTVLAQTKDQLKNSATAEVKIKSTGKTNTRDIANFAREQGYPGVKITDIYDNGGRGSEAGRGDVYIFFNPEQDVKSADPITYDDSGNVIPLTERFDSGNRDIRWSLTGTTDGRPVAVIDKDILDGVPESEWKSVARKAISEGFPDGIAVQGKNIRVNQTTRREYTKSDYTQWLFNHSKGVFADKMRAAAKLDDVVLAATNWTKDGGLKHPRKDNFVDFGRGNVLMSIGGNKYSAEVILAYPQVGAPVLYDVVTLNPDSFDLINEKAASANANAATSGAHTTRFSSDISAPNTVGLTQNTPDVNSQYMREGEKDSSSERHSLVKSAQSETETIEAEDKAIKNVLEKFSKERYYKSGYPYKFNEFLNRIADLSETSGERIPREQLLDTVKRLFRYAYENRLDGKALGRDYRHDADILAAMVGDIENEIYDWVSPLRDEYNEARDVKKKLRTEKIFVPTEIRASVAKAAGFETWSDFRKSLFGIVGLVNEQKGRALSEVYAELSEIYPEYFPDNITDGTEQAVLIADLARNMRVNGIGESNVLSYEEQLVKKSIGRAISELLYNGENTVSINAMRKRIAQLKEQREKAITSLKEKYAEQFKNRSEKQKQTVLRNKVLRKYTEASSMLDRPTTENHFTEAMRKPLMEFLAAVDITTGKSMAKQGVYDRILRVIEAANNATAEDGKNGLDIAETDLNVQEKQLIVDSGLLERMSAWVEANQGKKLTELSSAQLFDQIVCNEPPVGYVHLDLLQQPYFAADTVRISYEQHTEKNLRLDSRASVILAVIRLADSAGTSSSNTILSQA